MTKAEVIERLNENAEWLKEDIADLENRILGIAVKMQGKSAERIITLGEYITKYAKDIDALKRDLRDVETRIKIVNHIED